MFPTCCAMKPRFSPVSGWSRRRYETGLSASIAESDVEPSSDWTLVFNRWSELWKMEPEYVELPLSNTAKTVVEALFTTAKAVVDAVSGPQTVKRAEGDVVPMPRFPAAVKRPTSARFPVLFVKKASAPDTPFAVWRVLMP